jgi:hypothetical protein
LDTWRDLNSRPALAELSRLLWGRPAPRIPNTDEGLPAPLGQVAALATVVRCERRWADPGFAGHDRRVVSQEVAECFGAAIQQTLAVGREGRRPLRVRSRCEVLPPGEPASITIEVRAATGEVRLDAEIPITWLVDIWGRAAAAVDGRLVVEAEAVAIDRMAVAAIDWGLDGSLTKVDPHLTSAWVVRQGTGWHIDAASAAPRLTRQPWCSVDAMARGR